MVTLNTSASVTLDANGNGMVSLGPNAGPPVWTISHVSVSTTRPGLAPVPRFTMYLDSNPNCSLGLSYDGSFDETDCGITVTRGQNLVGQWKGGQSGDVATMSVSGEKVDG